MQALLRQAWWALLIGGIASVIFGVLAFMWPGLTLFVLAVFFAATVFVDGVVTIISAIRNRATASHWWLWLLLGLLGVVQLAIPCLLAVRVSQVLSAPEISLLALLEVVFGVAWVWLGTHEAPSVAVLGGGMMVLGALTLNEWLALRRDAGPALR